MDSSQHARRERRTFKIGDKIVRVDDIENPTWEQVGYKEALSPNQPLKFPSIANGVVSEITLVPQPSGRNQMGDIGWVPKEPDFIATMIEARHARGKGRHQGRRPDPHRERPADSRHSPCWLTC